MPKNLTTKHLFDIIKVADKAKQDALKEALEDCKIIIADDSTQEGKAVLHECERFKIPCLGKSEIFEV